VVGRAPVGRTAGGELRPLGASWPGLAALPAPACPGQSEADIESRRQATAAPGSCREWTFRPTPAPADGCVPGPWGSHGLRCAGQPWRAHGAPSQSRHHALGPSSPGATGLGRSVIPHAARAYGAWVAAIGGGAALDRRASPMHDLSLHAAALLQTASPRGGTPGAAPPGSSSSLRPARSPSTPLSPGLHNSESGRRGAHGDPAALPLSVPRAQLAV
jgi:hypothetical protein